MTIDEGINEYSEWSCTCENLNMHTENDPSGCGCVPGQWSIKRLSKSEVNAQLRSNFEHGYQMNITQNKNNWMNRGGKECTWVMNWFTSMKTNISN